MQMGSILNVVVGGLGIATLISLGFFMFHCEKYKKEERRVFVLKVRNSLIIFLILISMFATGLILVMDWFIASGVILGLLILVTGVFMEYLRPMKFFKKRFHWVPDWKVTVIAGIMMIIIGVVGIVAYPITDTIHDARMISLTLVGVGLLISFVSLVSIRDNRSV